MRNKTGRKWRTVFTAFLMVVGMALIPRRALFWCLVAIGGALIVCNLITRFSDREIPVLRHILPPLYTTLFFGAVYGGYGYTFLNGNSFPFWIPALLVGVLVGAYSFRKAMRSDEKSWWLPPLSALIIAFFVFFCTSSFLNFANYALETSEPIRQESIIYDKTAIHHRRSRDSHKFVIRVNGKQFSLEVSHDTYEAYNVGDTYHFSAYNGAFGVPFYVAE